MKLRYENMLMSIRDVISDLERYQLDIELAEARGDSEEIERKWMDAKAVLQWGLS